MHILHLGWRCALYPVAQHGAAHQAQHGSYHAAGSVADIVANGAPGNRTHGSTGAGFCTRCGHLLGGAHLPWHADLLYHRGAADHAADFLGGAQSGGQSQQQGEGDFFHGNFLFVV